MPISRRKALKLSGTALTGMSIGALTGGPILAQGGQQAQDFPDTLVDGPLRDGFPADLPLLPDGSAPLHDPSEAGEITQPLMWRTEGRRTPDLDPDYRNLAVRVDTRGLGRLRGTLHFSDLERLPQISATYLLQCGAANPRGVVTWTGVRFADFVAMLGLHEGVHYCRFTAADGFYADEDMTTLRHRQVMLAWMMNGEAIQADHGAPLRLIVPFRYGNRSIKSITGMMFATPGLPPPTA
jgi:DMSO/TMAO reductase YedYZ molybdopterin-dependent catalytic subunit